MSNLAYEMDGEESQGAARPVDARPIPRITIQAFCDTPEIAGTIETAATDRRMARAHVKVHAGGIAAAAEFYRSAPTPNLILVESRLAPIAGAAETDLRDGHSGHAQRSTPHLHPATTRPATWACGPCAEPFLNPTVSPPVVVRGDREI